MTAVLLSKIVPNPWRDLDLYPLDQVQIEKLVASINRHGFFGGVTARPGPNGTYQLGMGHHRIEAARRAKLAKIDIDTRQITDDEMIRLMTSENAIQAGSKIAAIMNEVSAAVRMLAKPMLVVEHLSGIPERWSQIAQCFQSQKAFDVARGTLEKGDGIGVPLIRAYLGGSGDQELCPRSQEQIKDGLATIKASGHYAKIITEVSEEIAAEAAQAEREAEEAEREAERAAKVKGGKAAATKKAKGKASDARKRQTNAKKASERAAKTKTSSRKHHDRIFDERCIQVFANDDQVRAFREAVTTESAQRFIAVEQQLAIAKELVASIGAGNAQENKNNRGRISAGYIKTFVAGVISDAIGHQRKLDEAEKQRLLDQQQDEIFHGKIKELLWALRSVFGIAAKLGALVRKTPKWAADPRLGALEVRIDDAVKALLALKGAINGESIAQAEESESATERRAIADHSGTPSQQS